MSQRELVPSDLAKIPGIAERQAETLQPGQALAAAELAFYDVEGVKFRLTVEKDEHDLRKEYLPKLFNLIRIWLIIVVLFVALASLKLISLSDGVLIAFITSTTVSVIGLFTVAGRWLFRSSS